MTKYWKQPPRIKVLEALGCIADGRIAVSGGQAEVRSSDKTKTYTVLFTPPATITANDNGSYWQGYLGYPSIAFLLQAGEIPYNPEAAEALKGIPWKKLNDEHKQDYKKVENAVLEKMDIRVRNIVRQCIENIMNVLAASPPERPTGTRQHPAQRHA